MSRSLWSRAFQHRWLGRSSRTASSTRPDFSSRRRVRPSLEVLEDRTVPAVFNIAAGDTQGLIIAMESANTNGDSSNVINLTNSTYSLQTVNNNNYGPNGLPVIANNLTIHGNGATIARLSGGGFGTPDFRLIYVLGGMEGAPGSLTMDNVTLENGLAKGGDSNQGGGGLGAGGAIFNQGTLNLTDVTFTDNEALGGSSGVSTAGNGGGGMGTNSPAANSDGGGMGFIGGNGGGATGGLGGGGGGEGFLLAASSGGNATDLAPGDGGGRSGFGGGGFGGDGGAGGQGTANGNATTSGAGGLFGRGGLAGLEASNGAGSGSGGGGVGVGAGGGAGAYFGGSGGFGGGGGFGGAGGGGGGFGGGGGGNSVSGGPGSTPGFGGGAGGDGFGGNGAGMGGAIFNMGADSTHSGSGLATLVNCTLYANFAAAPSSSGGQALGGALFNLDGIVSLTNDTLAHNAAFQGADVYNLAYGNDIPTGRLTGASLILNNNILASPNVAGALFSQAVNGNSTNFATVSGSHNLVVSSSGNISPSVITLTADPKLGPLQNNGGLTPTLLPQPGSPVLGAGDPIVAPPTDQRGLPRGGHIDLGSVQVSVTPPSGGSTPSPTPPALHKPFLLAFFDDFLKGVETVNGNGTETVTDNLFGFPLVSLYDSAGNLEHVTLLGFDITVLFE
jgi:hypothetical protein